MKRRHTHRARRPAFSLIELVIAIALTGIVSLALMSALLLSVGAIPDSDDAALLAARIDNANEFLLADAMLASQITASSTAKITLTVPDQTGDDTPETIVYAFDSGTLTRAVNGAAARTLVDGFSAGQFAVTATDGRVTGITAVIRTVRGSMFRVSVECLTRPEVI
tara:strand:- start:4 stop:501 length:498 start_codon:yes stop_codon:yes gene_type:complete